MSVGLYYIVCATLMVAVKKLKIFSHIVNTLGHFIFP